MTANKPLLVGAFALGGLALGVLAILLFGGAHLFSRSAHIVSVFTGSVAGVAVGSPVTFRGVTIGKVEGIQVQLDETNHTGVIPVYMEIEPGKVEWTNGSFRGDAPSMAAAIKAGLRAQLHTQSLVTGQLTVDLDFYPGTPIILAHLKGKTLELPTMPSDMQNLQDEIRDLNLRDLADRTRLTMASMQHLLDEAGARIGPLADSLQSTLETARTTLVAVQGHSARTLDNIDQLAVEGRGQIATNGRDLDQLLRTAQATAVQAEKLVATLNDMTAPRSPLRDDLQSSVRDLAASAGSLRAFTHDLERDPTGTLFRKAAR
jgi:phospholipid/cholesterol/gamma-HCH transport system substrate-binding protein